MQCLLAVNFNNVSIQDPNCLTYDSSFIGSFSLDMYVKLTACSSLSSTNRTALWSWEGSYLLRHTESSYCLTAETIAYGSR